MSLVDGRRCAAQSEQRVHRRLGGTDRVFDREHDVVGEFAELADEGEVRRALRDYLGPIALARRRNWLVTNGIMHGMHVEVFNMWSGSASIRKWPMISVMISLPVHADIGFFTKSPGLSTKSP